ARFYAPARFRHAERARGGSARSFHRRARGADVPERDLRLPVIRPAGSQPSRTGAALPLRPAWESNRALPGAQVGRPGRDGGGRGDRIRHGRGRRDAPPSPGQRGARRGLGGPLRADGPFPDGGPAVPGGRRDARRRRRPRRRHGGDRSGHAGRLRRAVFESAPPCRRRAGARGGGASARPAARRRQHLFVASAAPARGARRGPGDPQRHQVPLRARSGPGRRRLRPAGSGGGHRAHAPPPRRRDEPVRGLDATRRRQDLAVADGPPRRKRRPPGAPPGRAPRRLPRRLPRSPRPPRARDGAAPGGCRRRPLRRHAFVLPAWGLGRHRSVPRRPEALHARRQPRRMRHPDLAVRLHRPDSAFGGHRGPRRPRDRPPPRSRPGPASGGRRL
ncbi:MAG: O-acetylhomoserine sulfhydrylase / O-succinylhomoserine sulfhydrylase, partial [uncultured Thermomicrobiales bacterium]